MRYLVLLLLCGCVHMSDSELESEARLCEDALTDQGEKDACWDKVYKRWEYKKRKEQKRTTKCPKGQVAIGDDFHGFKCYESGTVSDWLRGTL